MKAIEKHRDSTLKGKLNSYVFKAKDVREHVDNLRQEVNRIMQRFMVCYPYRSLSRHGTNALQVQCLIDMRALQTFMSLQAQPPPDMVTTQITTAISYSQNDASSHRDRTQNVTRVVQEVMTRRQCSLPLKNFSTVCTGVYIRLYVSS